MKVKRHNFAHNSGMRGGEEPKAPQAEEAEKQDLTPPADVAKPAAVKSEAGAFDSGMRGAEKPVKNANAIAADVAQNAQLGSGTEAIAQGEMPPEYEAGDHFAIPKAHLIDGGDHYKLMKKKPSA